MGILDSVISARAADVSSWRSVLDSAPTFTPRMRPEIGTSDDLTRILAIPRRPPIDLESGPTKDALVEIMTARLSRGPRQCACATIAPGRPCITRLLPVQAWALYEAPLANGLLAPVGTGAGKTGLDILIALVMPNVKRAVLLIPPGLREQLIQAYLLWREHFHVPSLVLERGAGYTVQGRPIVHVVPFSRFSRHESTELLESLKPDLIIVDEAHKLKDRRTTTTGRVLRYFAANPNTRMCAWSGTLTSNSLRDYAHLSAFALRENSPVPLDPHTVEEWCTAIDPSDFPAPAGALGALQGPGEDLYKGFQRRLKQTRGVVATDESACKSSLYMHRRKTPAMPAEVERHLKHLRTTWERPDGEELMTALDVASCAKQLALGFYYRWKFPKGEPRDLIERWFATRKAWNKEVRELLKNPVPHLDSPMLCENAAKRAIAGYTGDLPVWQSETYEEWAAVKDAVYHEQDTVWVDDFMAADAAHFAKACKSVIWYEYGAFGRRIAELTGLPRYGGGKAAEEGILAETGKTSIIASIKAHGTGRDGLQYHFDTQLITSQPSSGLLSEQLLARIHRPGQGADEVHTYLNLHTPEMCDALENAKRDAAYIEGTMGTRQKLLSATFTF